MKSIIDGLTPEDVQKLERMARENRDKNRFQELFENLEFSDLFEFCVYLRECDDLKLQEASNMLQWHDQRLAEMVPDPRNLEAVAEELVQTSNILKEFAVFLRRQEILEAVEKAR